MTAYEMGLAAVLISGVTGLPLAWLLWRRTGSRSTALALGTGVAVVAVAVAAWLYYTRVLCPPGAGCA